MITSLPVCGNATKFRMLMFVQCFYQKFCQTVADIDNSRKYTITIQANDTMQTIRI
jgi:hypothetical protein